MDSNSVSLAYTGDVKITVYQNGRVISVKHYKNAGTLPLFRFIGNCLVGNFNSAGRLRPFKIKLLEAQENDASKAFDAETEFEEISNFITLASAPELKTFGTGSTGKCQAIFSFIFPIARINRSGANTIAIYGVDAANPKEYCAYHKLTKIVNSEGTEIVEWDPIKLLEEDYEENKVFAVEWTMTIANRT